LGADGSVSEVTACGVEGRGSIPGRGCRMLPSPLRHEWLGAYRADTWD